MQDETSQTDGKTMTDAQKRFIFRLMAGQGIEAEKAHQQNSSIKNAHMIALLMLLVLKRQKQKE